MKTMRCNIVAKFLVLCFYALGFSPLAMVAQQQQLSETRKISRSFAVTKDTDVEVINKYGMVHVETWDKDSVLFEIETTANAKYKEDISSILNNIDFQFINTNHYVVAKTIFINPTKLLIKDLKNMFGKSNDVSINYTVFVPRKLSLKLENKYGDMYVGALAGNISIKVSYGSLKADVVDGKLSLNVEFGHADVNKVDAANVYLNFSDLRIKKVKQIDLRSNFSDATIDEAGSVTLNSKQDDINITDVKELVGSCNFTNMKLGFLEKSLNLDSRFGNIDVMKLSPSFTSMRVGTNYTDLNIFFNIELTGFDADILHRNSRLMYPRSCNLVEVMANPKVKQYRTTGRMGAAQGKGNVYIDANYGEINFKKN